jgi:hypothetical protein
LPLRTKRRVIFVSLPLIKVPVAPPMIILERKREQEQRECAADKAEYEFRHVTNHVTMITRKRNIDATAKPSIGFCGMVLPQLKKP